MSAVVVGASITLLALLTGAFGRRAHVVSARNEMLRRIADGAERRSRVAWAFWRAPPQWLIRRTEGIALPAGLDDAWRWWCMAAALVVLLGLVANGPVLAFVGLALVGVAPVAGLGLLRSRSAAAYDATLAAALDAVARGVRSGGSLAAAIAEAASAVRGPVADDITQVGSAVRRGVPLAEALLSWDGRRQRASVHLSVGALVLAAETGGPPARVIEEVSAALRQRLHLEGEARAMASQARLSAVVVGCAPIAFAALTCATDPRNAHLLFGTPIGVVCVVAGLSLDAVGAVWMHRLSESVVR